MSHGEILIGRFEAISHQPSTLHQSFLWGNDLSGSMDGAGGVGGLLLITDEQLITAHFPSYDGNGNLTALVDTTGTSTASYEYSPFGQLLRCEGEYAKANPFRFSTKFTDDETGLLYYGYCYYSTTMRRWISKDPLEEEGGVNLYAFCENNGITGFDLLGQMLLADVAGTNGGQASEKAWEIERGNSLIGRVREWVETMNEIQGFIEDVMDSVEGDSDDLLISLFEMGRSVAGNGLKMFAGDSGDDDTSAGGGMAFSAMRSGWKAPDRAQLSGPLIC